MSRGVRAIVFGTKNECEWISMVSLAPELTKDGHHSGPQLWHSGRVDIDFVYHLAADTRVPAKAGEGRVEGKR